MLNILGKIYNLFTGNVIGNIVGAMLFSFLQYIAGSCLKGLMKNPTKFFTAAMSSAA